MLSFFFFFFNDTATTEIYTSIDTLSLHDALPIYMRPACSYTDFFVICTGRNARQTKAIWYEVHERLKHDERVLPQHVEGASEGTWIVGDYLDTVLHVFTPEARDYYRLEELWGDVPSVSVGAASATA